MTMAVVTACLLTAGVTLAIVLWGVNLNNKAVNPFDHVSDVAAASAENDSDAEVKMSENAAGTNAPDKIIIPGFAKLTFNAGKDEQSVMLHNPEENSCYFVVTILLPNNTEIYQSGLMAPGSSLTKIKLSRIPEPGIYEDAIIRYSCFDLDTLKGLNGANTKIILEVR